MSKKDTLARQLAEELKGLRFQVLVYDQEWKVTRTPEVPVLNILFPSLFELH